MAETSPPCQWPIPLYLLYVVLWPSRLSTSTMSSNQALTCGPSTQVTLCEVSTSAAQPGVSLLTSRAPNASCFLLWECLAVAPATAAPLISTAIQRWGPVHLHWTEQGSFTSDSTQLQHQYSRLYYLKLSLTGTLFTHIQWISIYLVPTMYREFQPELKTVVRYTRILKD